MSELIVNRVAESALVTINLEDFLPTQQPVVFDLIDFLYKGLIVREKEFREALKETNWEIYRNQTVLVTCTADAIIPFWAYMLAASALAQVTNQVYLETETEWKNRLLLEKIRAIDPGVFADKRIVVKGCGETPIPEDAYFEITKKLQPVVKSIMYGEPCSTVPVYKKK